MMADNDLCKEATKALALGESEKAKTLGDEVFGEDKEKLYHYVIATAFLMVEKHFESDHSLDTIKAFVDELRQDFRKAETAIKPLVVEAFIRAVWGEDHLLDDVRASDQYMSGVALIRKIGFDSAKIRSNIDTLMEEATELAHEWMSGELGFPGNPAQCDLPAASARGLRAPENIGHGWSVRP